MKATKSILFCYLCSIMALLTVASCKKNKNTTNACSNVVCQHGGVCNAGKCTCPANYSGTYCEIYTSPVTPPVTGSSDTVILYGTYTYWAGQAPTFLVDSMYPASAVTYGTVTAIPNNSTQRVDVTVNSVRITVNGVKRSATGFSIEEQHSNNPTWFIQQEFGAANTSVNSKLATVLVLDMSTSLGSDVYRVKSSADSFANKYLQNQTGSLALVLFSQDIYKYDFSTSSSYVTGTINSYTLYQNATTLYGAVLAGLSMLDTFSASVDEKVLIAFTDGGDNNTSSPTAAVNSIQQSPHTRYSIGLIGKGDYDAASLKSIATTDQNFVQASNISELNSKFSEILTKISTISRIQYSRTNQTFTMGMDAATHVRIKIGLKH